MIAASAAQAAKSRPASSGGATKVLMRHGAALVLELVGQGYGSVHLDEFWHNQASFLSDLLVAVIGVRDRDGAATR